MIKIVLILLFIFIPVIKANSMEVNSIIKPKIFYNKLAKDESIFDESDLADIESGGSSQESEDALLEKEFNRLDDSESDDNFDKEDFEAIDEGNFEDTEESDNLDENEDEDEELSEGFDPDDYEFLSDKPGYEVITDSDLVKEFESDKDSDSIELENESTEDDEDIFENIGEDDLEEEDAQSLQEPESVLEGLPIDQSTDISEKNQELPVLEDLPEDDKLDLSEENTEDTLQEEVAQDSIEEETVEDTDIELEIMQEATDTQDQDLNLITNIRYLAERDQILIDSSEIPSYEERVNEENNQIIIEFLQSKLPKNLSWPYILKDFNTNFALIKADQKDSTTVRVVIQLKKEGELPPVNLSEDGILIIGRDSGSKAQDVSIGEAMDSTSVLPPKTLEELYFGNIEFTGTLISFHVIDADVKQVLRFISEESGLNMVIDESVQGKVTLKLEDVPWDQALYTIFKVNSLGYTRDGNVITVLALNKIEERTKKLREISERQKNLAPFHTKVLPIMYVKAQDIQSKIKEFSTQAVAGFSKGGRIIIHEESNSLIVIDNQDTIKKIESLVEFLDTPSQQVMVESKIVEVSKSFARSYGLNWNLSGDLPVRIGANGILDFFQTTLDGLSGSWSVQDKGRNNSFSLNGLPFIGDISATLNLAENNGTARVLNTTKILVRSGKQASIEKNTPIQVKNSDTQALQTGIENQGTVTSTFVQQDIKLSSSVTPTVTSAGSIAMNISITLSDPGPGGEGEVVSITRQATTEVLARNGQTIVLSGIYQKSENKGNNGIPFLRKIPILNFLFDNSNFSSAESEMLMFVTPTLIED